MAKEPALLQMWVDCVVEMSGGRSLGGRGHCRVGARLNATGLSAGVQLSIIQRPHRRAPKQVRNAEPTQGHGIHAPIFGILRMGLTGGVSSLALSSSCYL